MPRNAAAPTDDPLHEIQDGARTAMGRPVPLTRTAIEARILGGLALVRTERTFRNAEAESIEVTATMPVPVHAQLAAMSARIGGRVLRAEAMARTEARAAYEDGLEAGHTTVLHEELIRGVHMISVGHVSPGEEVAVASTWVQPLSYDGSAYTLKIPTTVGECYGRSPLADSDDLLIGDAVHLAELSVSCPDGAAHLLGGTSLVDGQATIALDRPIELDVVGWHPRTLRGVAADGRTVLLDVMPLPAGQGALRADLLLDESGSMHQAARFGEGRATGWQEMIRGLVTAGEAVLGPEDQLQAWAFANRPRQIYRGPGDGLAPALRRVRHGSGGTEVGLALDTVLASPFCANELLVVTDGRSHALDVQRLARQGRRISVVLVGEAALEAPLGHLAALTGGQLFVAGLSNVADAVTAAVAAMRRSRLAVLPIEGRPERIARAIAGMAVTATWTDPGTDAERSKDAATEEEKLVGAYAAALAIPAMAEPAAAALAEAHGLCCHLTSLVLVDEAGEAQQGLPAQRKVALSPPRALAAPAGMAAVPMPVRWRAPAGLSEVDRAMFAVDRDRGWAALRAISGQMDWSDPERLRRGDLGGLDPAVAAALRRAAQALEVRALAAAVGMDPLVVTVALLAGAAALAHRGAARLFRALLGTADPRALEAVRRAVGL
ncbi:MAG: VIT domain-containing protein [Janthinobacterium lividum]